MQFIGAKGITLFVAIVLISCGVGFGSGLLVGRQYPAHNFQRFGDTSYLLDSATGRVCALAAFNNPKNFFDSLGNHPGGGPGNGPGQHPTLAELLNKDYPGYPPPCEK